MTTISTLKESNLQTCSLMIHAEGSGGVQNWNSEDNLVGGTSGISEEWLGLGSVAALIYPNLPFFTLIYLDLP